MILGKIPFLDYCFSWSRPAARAAKLSRAENNTLQRGKDWPLMRPSAMILKWVSSSPEILEEDDHRCSYGLQTGSRRSTVENNEIVQIFPGSHKFRALFAARPQTIHTYCASFASWPTVFMFRKLEIWHKCFSWSGWRSDSSCPWFEDLFSLMTFTFPVSGPPDSFLYLHLLFILKREY